jgi:nickel-dependent lactate racemase
VSKSLSKLFKTKKNKPKIKREATAVVKELSPYVFVSESQNYKVNFTMFITIKAVRNSCVLTMRRAANSICR